VLHHVEGGHHVEGPVREGQSRGRSADSFTWHQSVREQVERDPQVVTAHPVDARGVGAADVENPAGTTHERLEHHSQQGRAGAVPPILRVAQ